MIKVFETEKRSLLGKKKVKVYERLYIPEEQVEKWNEMQKGTPNELWATIQRK